MDEENTNPAPVETKPAKKRAPRKSPIRKVVEGAEEVTVSAAASGDSKPARKPRTRKTPGGAATKLSADGTPDQGAKPAPLPRGRKSVQKTEAQQGSVPAASSQVEAPAVAKDTVVKVEMPQQNISTSEGNRSQTSSAQQAVSPAVIAPERTQKSEGEPSEQKSSSRQEHRDHDHHDRSAEHHSEREDRGIESLDREFEPTRVPGFAVPETVGGSESAGGNKRKRRRNRRRGGDNQPQPQQQSNIRIDSEELVRRAWKIYLGEVTEEGLALMDDRTAIEASRRAFRVAEHFLVEAARHRRAVLPPSSPEEPEAEQEIQGEGE